MFRKKVFLNENLLRYSFVCWKNVCHYKHLQSFFVSLFPFFSLPGRKKQYNYLNVHVNEITSRQSTSILETWILFPYFESLFSGFWFVFFFLLSFCSWYFSNRTNSARWNRNVIISFEEVGSSCAYGKVYALLSLRVIFSVWWLKMKFSWN